MAIFKKPVDKDKAIVELVSDKYSNRERQKQLIEEQWKLNLLFYRGHQNYQLRTYNDTNSRVERIEDIEGSTGFVMNLMQRTINDNVSLMLKNNPTITAVPATTDRNDQDKAEYTDKAIEWVFERQEMKLVMQEACTLSNLFGTSFYKIFWDEDAGDMIENAIPVGIVEKDGMLLPKIKTERKRQGDIRIAAISPANVIVDNNATNIHNCFYLVHYYTVNGELLKFKYKDKLKSLKKDFEYVDDVPFSLTPHKIHIDDKIVVVKELYMKPCDDYPDGLYAKVCGDILLETSDLAPEDWPWVRLVHYENPEEFWGETYATHLVPINQEYNKTCDQLLQYRDAVLNSPIAAQLGTISEDDLTNSQRQVWWYNGDKPPERIPPAPYPAALLNLSELHMAQHEEVSGITKAMKGQNPPGVRSSVTIQLLQEMTNQHLIPPAIRHEEALLALTRKFLRLMVQHYDESRMIQIVGKNHAYWVEPFKKDLIVENLRIQMYSSLPQSKAATQQFIMESAASGMINIADPKEKAWAWDAMDLGSRDVLLDNLRMDRDVQKRENETLSQGKYAKVQIWHDHRVHVEELIKFLNSYEFEQIQGQPSQEVNQQTGQPLTIGELAGIHFQEHNELIQQQIMAQMQLMQGVRGGSPQNGGQQQPTSLT